MAKIPCKTLPFLLTISLSLLLFPLVGQEADMKPGATKAAKEDLDKAGLGGWKSTEDIKKPKLQRGNRRYKIGKSDVIELKFPLIPEFNQTLTVHPDGFVTLHVAGDIRVEGKTMPELNEMLRSEYAKILQDPVFTVELKEFEQPHFIVSGQVDKPGKYELRGATTVTQAVALAGGFSDERAKHSQVLLFRGVSKDWVEVKVLDLKKMFQEADLSEDPRLKSGDMVFVPQNTISKIERFLPKPEVLFWFLR